VSTVGGVETVTRSCVPTCTEVGGGGSGISTHTYCCDSPDLCNGAVKPINQLPVIAVALFFGVAIAARLL